MLTTKKIKPLCKISKMRDYWLTPLLNKGKSIIIHGLKVDNGWYDMKSNPPIIYSDKFWKESKIRKNRVIVFQGKTLCPTCKRFGDSQSICSHCKSYLSGFFNTASN